MKNLSSIPRLSLFEAFTIFITLAVCLAGFTEAEVGSYSKKQAEGNYMSKEASMRENVPYSYKNTKLRGGELQQTNADSSNNYGGGSLEKLIKRQSDDFGESADSESEKENDGYGYDDDEYYHLNYKRNDDAVGNLESNKMNKENLGEMGKKEGMTALGQKCSIGKNNEKESQTIEMLDFKEYHPQIGNNDNQNQNQNQNADPSQKQSQNQMQNMRQYAYENAHKKLPSNSVDSLNMRDLKENSAIDEKMKDRKDESTGVLAAGSSDTKVTEAKKVLKTAEDKDTVKLKETKIVEETEKKEKETNLKDVKDNVASKGLKETVKGSEEKEKNVKLNDNAKLEENLEKINAKNKEGETAKITKEDKDSSRLRGKDSVDVINPNDLSQINNRASFVSNDYKDSLDAMKATAAEDDEKNSEEVAEPEKNVAANDYEDTREKQEKLRERQLSLQDDLGNEQDASGEMTQDAVKGSEYLTFPMTYEMKDENENDYFKKRESWKEHGKFHLENSLQQQMQDQQQSQQQQQPQQPQDPLAFEHDIKNSYHVKFPSSELENTEYHKNFIKSLKRYKGLSDNVKVITPESTSFSSVERSNFQETQASRKKKHSKPKKRRSMEKDKPEQPKSRRNAFRSEDRSRWLATERQSSQKLSSLKPAKDEPKLKSYNGQQENSRQRRKSPAKLEYEIKIINQNQQESKNPALSSLRLKKDVKSKLATDDKYLKKYPYSQVSRDDLTRLGERESEKKFKRKAPVWMRKDQNKESVIQTRGLPSGYYGNRVKFGQKNYARTEEKTNSEQSSSDLNKVSYAQVPLEKSSFQRAWEVKPQDYKHDPMKRYDESGFSKSHSGNALLLFKKGPNGERIAKTFEEETKDSDDKLDPDKLLKMLSKNKDYLILKKTDVDNSRKLIEPEASRTDFGLGSYQDKKSSLEGELPGKQSTKNKGVYTRSFHKEDKKFSSGPHQGGTKSNLKKTFEKFRDLADFFKDNEQESADTQYPSREVKEGRDIVFSEDKLPDPIVISSDSSGKSDRLSQKPTNSIYSISTNFKHLDQQDRKEESPKSNEINKNMLTSEVKSDSQEFSWEPALRNAFPEAKTINSMSKDGNEIIVLDFNRNQLKNEHGYLPAGKYVTKPPSMGTGGENWVPGNRLMNQLGQRQVEVVLPTKLTLFDKNRRDEDKLMVTPPEGAYAVFNNADGQTQVSIPLNQLALLPNLFKAMSEKKQNNYGANARALIKKSPKWESQGTDNYNQFLRDLRELSELNKKGKLSAKRNAKEVGMQSNSLQGLTTYGDVNMQNLGSILQSLMTNQNSNGKFGVVDNKKSGFGRDYEKEQWYPSAYNAQPGQWSASEVKTHPTGNKDGEFPAEMKEEELEKTQQSGAGSNNYEEELWEELAGASGTAQRLRRDGVRKAMEAMSSRDSQEWKKGEQCPAEGEEKCMESEMSDAKEEEAGAGEAENGREPGSSRLREEEEGKESLEQSKALKSEYEGHLNELFENLSSDKSGKGRLNVPNESGGNRGKRKDIDRRKRSSRRDVKNKVSTTDVQNRILKNLPEDIYSSVYSPGIKRKLLSTGNEAEDADGYYGADEHDKSEIAEGGEVNCVKNSRNKCVDPIILELFGAEDGLDGKNRDRRSLANEFHSNFKREIDLDESMPNDFQNFLVTSLGGVGSQKREVVKKEEALWEGKEGSQESYNQIAETPLGAKEMSEDSALEKREVSSGESHQKQKYKSTNYFESGKEPDSSLTEPLSAMSHSEKVTRSENKSPIGTKASEYEDKVPTQIRIQITNAGVKEKKSSKPIMDDSETTSTEMENLPKEKEFFDKNKINQLGVNSLPKLHQFQKPKFSLIDYEDCENPDAAKQKAFSTMQYRRRRRKKKKYVPENPMKPIKDFIAFDQKAMEILLRKYMADQNLANEQHTTQKVPMSNHLPQVETVYNPTQGTNKAQLDASRLTKINAISNKNSENSKNNLQSNDASAFDENILRTYFKDKSSKTKSDKNHYGKEYEEVDWKPYSGKVRIRTETPGVLSFQNFKSLGGEMPSSSNHPSSSTSSRIFNPYSQKMIQSPYTNYFFHPNTNIMGSNSFYDALKLKQEMKNYGMAKNILMKDHAPSKAQQKPYYFGDSSLYNKPDDKDRSPNYPAAADTGTWNAYDYNFNKKPFNQNLKTHDFYNPSLKTQVDSRSKASFPSSRAKFIKTLDDEKLFDSTAQSRSLDSSKDSDYLDVLDEDYADDESNKDIQFDEPIITDVIKKPNKLYDPATYHHMYNYKASDVDDPVGGDSDEEFEDDYDETADDDDLDDYSLLANSRDMEPELSKDLRATATLQSTYRPEDSFSQLTNFYPRTKQFELKGNSFEQTEFTNPKAEDNFEQGRKPMSLIDLKNDLDPLTSSSNILRKANENANIFGKNLMKNLNKYSYDESWRNPEKLQNDKPLVDVFPKYGRKIRKRKMDWQRKKLKRSQEYPYIGSRMFYISRSRLPEDSAIVRNLLSNSKRHANRDLRQDIPLTAQFTDTDLELESEAKGKLINGADDNCRCDDDEDVEDVQENLEDNGETISEDNVLENIIGKYIMRKRMPSVDQSKARLREEKKLEKRSAGGDGEAHRKSLQKRLSSGHLTESNYKKFHKKNGKRHVGNEENQAERREQQRRQNQTQQKRSALDLFRKITSKDRGDSKKTDIMDSHSTGFEPLQSFSNEKPEHSGKEIEDAVNHFTKKITKEELLDAQEAKEPANAKEDLGGQKKDKAKASVKADGPWKLELDEKFNVKEDLSEKETSSVKPETVDRKDDEENRDLKRTETFFVIGNSLRRAKRKLPRATPRSSGSSQTEVGTRGIYKTHIRKRSLEPSSPRTKSAPRDAQRPSLQQPIAESPLPIQRHNRALHDSQSLSETPHVQQRNSDKNESFVTDDEMNPRFLSKGKMTKSVFPPSSDENILRDSRDINEGTSEYLGQQIVEAILSHVSANPKFKEMIAPGLSMRAPLHKDTFEDKKGALHQIDFNDQMQSFLQKFMFDLQKLAEKHMQKRMCGRINKQSKEFLQSLLNIPAGRNEEAFEDGETRPSDSEDVTEPPLAPTTLETYPSLSPDHQTPETNQKVFDNLKKKQHILRKLIDEYQSLSKLQQQTLDVNYRYLVQELEHTNQELSFPAIHPCQVPDSNIFMTNTSREFIRKQFGFDSVREPNIYRKLCQNMENQSKPCGPDLSAKASPPPCPPPSHPLILPPCLPPCPPPCPPPSPLPCPKKSKFRPCPSILHPTTTPAEITTTPADEIFPTPTTHPTGLPLYCFEPEEKTSSPEGHTTPSAFESVHSINSSIKIVKNPDAALNPSPQTFDLLAPEKNSSTPFPSLFNPFLPLPSSNSESVRIKQSAPKDNSFSSSENEFTSGLQNFFPGYSAAKMSSALNQLNTGDAAGLQLSLKSRDPWVSTLDVAKSFRNLPNSLAPNPRPSDTDAPLAPKRPRSSLPTYHPLFAPKANIFDKPAFPFTIDRKLFAKKVRPFLSTIGVRARHLQNNCQMVPFQYFLRKYPMHGASRRKPITHGLENYKINSKGTQQRMRKKKKKKKRKRAGRHSRAQPQQRSPWPAVHRTRSSGGLNANTLGQGRYNRKSLS